MGKILPESNMYESVEIVGPVIREASNEIIRRFSPLRSHRVPLLVCLPVTTVVCHANLANRHPHWSKMQLSTTFSSLLWPIIDEFFQDASITRPRRGQPARLGGEQHPEINTYIGSHPAACWCRNDTLNFSRCVPRYFTNQQIVTPPTKPQVIINS